MVYIGLVTGRSDLMTKKNEPMTFLTVEDLYGEAEVIVFPKLYRQVREILTEDAILEIRGKLQVTEHDEHAKIIAEQIISAGSSADSRGTLYLKLLSEQDTQTNQVLEMLRKYPGPSDVGLYFEKEQKKLKGKNFRINAGEPALIQGLKRILGDENVVWTERM